MDIHFHEHMGGRYTGIDPSYGNGQFHFTIDVHCERVTDPRVVTGKLTGKATMEHVVEDAPLQGSIEISPAWKRRIAYAFTFALPDGRTFRFDGAKKVSLLRLAHSMTFLPGTIYNEKGERVAEAAVSFRIVSDILPFLGSFRVRRGGKGGERAEVV